MVDFRSMGIKNLNSSGFTLLELMFSVLIVGALCAIAFPSYKAYIDKSNNGMAMSDIAVIMQSIESYYTAAGQYPPTMADIAGVPHNGKDPWGNAYVYLNIINGGPGIKGQVRKDHALNPINTYYDLYSMGKDGVTKKQITQKDSVDDIIVARDAQFVGLASDF